MKKKLIVCALVLSTLASSASMCFAYPPVDPENDATVPVNNEVQIDIPEQIPAPHGEVQIEIPEQVPAPHGLGLRNENDPLLEQEYVGSCELCTVLCCGGFLSCCCASCIAPLWNRVDPGSAKDMIDFTYNPASFDYEYTMDISSCIPQ